MTYKVLVVDDQPAVRQALEMLFELADIPTLSASHPREVLDVIARDDVGVVIQDMNFTADKTSGQEGVELFRAIRKLDPDIPVLLMTAWTSLETAVQLVKEGATDYLAKPWDDDKLLATVKHLIRLRALGDENARLRACGARERRELAAKHDLRGLVYASDAMRAVISLATHVAPSDAPVLITGPNGAGKERIAEIIQANSRRKNTPFVRVNAGGLPDELLEAELFGAEAGAYTGATKQRIGRFEAAHGGTLFLDEIGNLSASGQMKLLRVLQTGEFERLGSSTTRKVDVRLVSATNADLPKMIAAGTFREDLYFRINVIELRVPPLARRVDDIVPLAAQFLSSAEGTPKRLSPAAERALLDHDWPGNVRELQNRIQRACLVARTAELTPEDLGFDAKAAPPAPAQLDPEAAAERAHLEEVIDRVGGVVAKAAAELGVSRQALYRRMERLGIVLERRARSP